MIYITPWKVTRMVKSQQEAIYVTDIRGRSMLQVCNCQNKESTWFHLSSEKFNNKYEDVATTIRTQCVWSTKEGELDEGEYLWGNLIIIIKTASPLATHKHENCATFSCSFHRFFFEPTPGPKYRCRSCASTWGPRTWYHMMRAKFKVRTCTA